MRLENTVLRSCELLHQSKTCMGCHWMNRWSRKGQKIPNNTCSWHSSWHSTWPGWEGTSRFGCKIQRKHAATMPERTTCQSLKCTMKAIGGERQTVLLFSYETQCTMRITYLAKCTKLNRGTFAIEINIFSLGEVLHRNF